MTQLALYAFLVAGAFLGVAYFDLYFLLIAASVMLHVLSLQAQAAGPAAPPAAALAPSASHQPSPLRRRRGLR
jgi:hypothetical protein